MKKHNYFAPAIEEVLMVVEQGIAASDNTSGEFVGGSDAETGPDEF